MVTLMRKYKQVEAQIKVYADTLSKYIIESGCVLYTEPVYTKLTGTRPIRTYPSLPAINVPTGSTGKEESDQ